MTSFVRIILPATLTSVLYSASVSAATVTALGATVSTDVSENAPPTVDSVYNAADPTIPQSLPEPFSSIQLADFQGNGGNADVAAALDDLSYSVPDGTGTFAYSGKDFGRVSVTDNAKANSPNNNSIDIRSFAQYTFSFELDPGETMLANFDFTYSVKIDNDVQNSASVFWELTTPESARSDIFREIDYFNTPVSDPVDETVNVMQSAILDQAGIYNFTLWAEIPEQEFKNSKKDVIVTFDDVYMEVINIPEPSSASLLMLAGCTFLLRRKRS